ncbi:response regulator transcription factor [Aurantimonas sp. A3-2-R12]|uniref:response regulator transcription factor n=1 Tax=Aurantimonas sp. A3-2-R12 TaxID=3114362 RepID=UPI002E184559|nr:response regulator transcription factor [Aurantimonas sp. A3-2-R12]
MTRRTVVIADDHPLVLDGLSNLIDRSGRFEVIAAFSDGLLACEAILQLSPDLAVLDVAMPMMGGIEVLCNIRASRSPTRVVLLTASMRDEQLLDAVAAGLHGLVLKETAPELLIRVMIDVAAGRKHLPQAWIRAATKREDARRQEPQQRLPQLTASEHKIARLVASGLSNKEIASSLGISSATVKNHLHNAYQKLGVTNRTALASALMRVAGG